MSLLSSGFKSVNKAVNDAFRGANDFVNGAYKGAEEFVRRQTSWLDKRLGITKARDTAADAVDWARAHSGYDHVSSEVENSYFLQLGVGLIMPPLGYYFAYRGAQKIITPYVYEMGRWTGKQIRDNFKGDWMYAGMGLVYLGFAPMGATVYGLDQFTGGAFDAGMTDAFLNEAVELTDPLEWDYYPEQYDAYKWFPGSFEWNAAGAGGELYNATALLEPWEKMNNRRQELDSTGFMMDNFYESNMPASPELTYPGSSHYMDIYGGK